MELPLYLKIVEDIVKDIKSGTLQPGDALPSENALCDAFRASRMTVRKGLAILANEGYIKSIPGKGNFVTTPNIEKYTLFYNEMTNLINSVDKTQLLGVDIIQPTDNLLKSLNITGNKKVIVIKRLFFTDGDPVAYDLKYLVYHKGMPIVEKEIKHETFPGMVSKFASLFTIKKELTISAQLPSAEVKKLLSLHSTVPMLVVEQKFFNAENKPIGIGTTSFRGDYCQLFASSSFSDFS